MAGIMQISPQTFTGDNAETLPIFLPKPAVAGATADWDARTLSGAYNTPVTSWASYVSGGPTLVPGGGNIAGATAPTLVELADNAPAVRFNGTNNSIGAPMNRTMPNTVIVVAKPLTIPNQISAFVGGGPNQSAPAGIVGVNGQSVARTYNGQSLDLTGTVITPGVTRVFMGVFSPTAGADITRVDNTEIAGESGSNTTNLISVGAYGIAFANVDIQRILYYPFALDASQRAAAVAGLREEYNL